MKNAAIRKGEAFDTPMSTERELGIAVGDVKVDAHAGHQVEIKGYFVGDDEEGKDGGASGKRSPQSELRSVNAGGNDIKVTAIRSLANDCPVR